MLHMTLRARDAVELKLHDGSTIVVSMTKVEPGRVRVSIEAPIEVGIRRLLRDSPHVDHEEARKADPQEK